MSNKPTAGNAVPVIETFLNEAIIEGFSADPTEEIRKRRSAFTK